MISKISFTSNPNSVIPFKSTPMDEVDTLLTSYDSQKPLTADKNKGVFDEFALAPQEILKNETVKTVVRPSVKIAGAVILGTTGFFTGKFMFSSQIVKNIISGINTAASKTCKKDFGEAFGRFSEKLSDNLVKFRESHPIMEKYPNFMSKIKAEGAKFLEDFSKKGIKNDVIQEFAEEAKVSVESASKRLFVQNGALKGLGAVVGLGTAYISAKEALQTPADKIPDLFKKKVNTAKTLVLSNPD